MLRDNLFFEEWSSRALNSILVLFLICLLFTSVFSNVTLAEPKGPFSEKTNSNGVTEKIEVKEKNWTKDGFLNNTSQNKDENNLEDQEKDECNPICRPADVEKNNHYSKQSNKGRYKRDLQNKNNVNHSEAEIELEKETPKDRVYTDKEDRDYPEENVISQSDKCKMNFLRNYSKRNSKKQTKTDLKVMNSSLRRDMEVDGSVNIDSPTSGSVNAPLDVLWTNTLDDSEYDELELTWEGPGSKTTKKVWSPSNDPGEYTISADSIYNGDNEIKLTAYTQNDIFVDNDKVSVDVSGGVDTPGPPEINILEPKNNVEYYSPKLILNWKVTDNCEYELNTIKHRLDDNGWIEHSASGDVDEGEYNYNDLADGSNHDIEVWANNTGEYNDSVTHSFTVVNPKPTISIEDPPNNKVISSEDITVNWSSSDEGYNGFGIDFHKVQKNGNSWKDPDSSNSHQFSNLQEGDNNLEVKVVDKKGKYDTDSVSVTLDQSKPSLDINLKNNEDGIFNESDVTIEWWGEDEYTSIDHYVIKKDGVKAKEYYENSSHTFNNLEDGNHTLGVTAFDEVGNSIKKNINITIDTKEPNVSIDSPNDETIQDSSNITLWWNSSDGGSGIDHYEIKSGSNDFQNESSPYNFTGLTDGQYSLYVKSVDRAGNTAIENVNITIDTTSPKVNITDPKESTIHNKSNLSICWKGSDNVSGIKNYEVKRDSNDYRNIEKNTSYEFIDLSDGSHILYVKAVDDAGNTATNNVNITVDTIDPNADAGGHYTIEEGNNLTFNGTASSDNDEIESWQWDWTNDGTYEGSGAKPTHNYSEAGNHTVKLQVTDRAGNTDKDNAIVIVKDVTPPTVNITNPGDNSIFNSSHIPIEWSGEDNNAVDHYEVKYDSYSYTNVGSNNSYEFVNISNGEHDFSVKAVDGWGNKAEDNITVIVDTVRPIIEINSPKEGVVYPSDNITINWSSSNNATDLGISNNKIRRDNVSGWKNLSSTTKKSYYNLNNGQHEVHIRTSDEAGNTATTNVTFTIDTDSPIIEIDSPCDDEYLDNDSVELSWTGSDNTTELNYKVKSNKNGDEWEDVNSSTSKTLKNLSNGTHDIYVKAIDEAGNNATANVTFTVDTEKPLTNVTMSRKSHIFNSTSVRIQWNTSESVSGLKKYRLVLNGTEIYSGTNESYQFSNLADGKKEIILIAVDKAGNTFEKEFNITIDTTSPEVSLIRPDKSEKFNTSCVRFEWNSNFSISGFSQYKLKMNGTERYSGKNESIELSNLGDGRKRFTLISIDKAGNKAETTFNITIDTHRPEITIISPKKDAIIKSDSIKLNWKSWNNKTHLGIDGHVMFLDDKRIGSKIQNSSHTFESLSDGEHTIRIKAIDEAGNNAKANFTFTVDTEPPLTNVTMSHKSHIFNSTSVGIQWNTSESVSGLKKYRLVLNGTEVYSGTNEFYQFSNLSDGKKEITLIAVDKAGNKAETTFNITIDTHRPEITIISQKKDAIMKKDSIKLNWESWNNKTHLGIDGHMMYLDDKRVGSKIQNSSHTFENLSDGEHTIRIKAIDEAGNNRNDSISFTIDTIPPEIEITSPQHGERIFNESITMDWEASDNTSSVDFYEVKIDRTEWVKLVNETDHELNSLDTGERRIEVRAVDKAGNSANASVRFEILPDQILEEVEVNDGDPKTTEKKVSVDIGVRDEIYNLTKIRVALDESFTKKTTGWTKYEENFSYGLLSESGNYTIYIEAKTEEGLRTGTFSREINYKLNESEQVEDEIDLEYLGVSTIVFEENLEYELRWDNNGSNKVNEYGLIANSSKRESWVHKKELTDTNFTYKFEKNEKVCFELIAKDESGNEENITFNVTANLLDLNKTSKEWKVGQSERLSVDIPEERKEEINVTWYVDGEKKEDGFVYEPDLGSGEHSILVGISDGSRNINKVKRYDIEIESKKEEGFPSFYIIAGVGSIVGGLLVGILLIKRRKNKTGVSTQSEKPMSQKRNISGSSKVNLSEENTSTKNRTVENGSSHTVSNQGQRQTVQSRSQSSIDEKTKQSSSVSNGASQSFVDSTTVIKSIFKEKGEATKQEIRDHLRNKKGLEVSPKEIEKEIKELIQEEKLTLQPQRTGSNLYKWNEN